MLATNVGGEFHENKLEGGGDLGCYLRLLRECLDICTFICHIYQFSIIKNYQNNKYIYEILCSVNKSL